MAGDVTEEDPAFEYPSYSPITKLEPGSRPHAGPHTSAAVNLENLFGPLSAVPTAHGVSRTAQAEQQAQREAVYGAMREQAAGFGQQAADVQRAGTQAAGAVSGDLSRSLVAASAGRNPWASQQASLDAGRERAAILGQTAVQVGTINQQKLDKYAQIAEAKGMVPPDSVAAQQEIEAWQTSMINAIPFLASEDEEIGLGLWDWGNHRFPWMTMYQWAMSALAGSTTQGARNHWQSYLNTIQAEWSHYQQAKDADK